jgi:hypothetical protein
LCCSDRNPLDLVERNFILPPVVKLRRPGRFVVGDVLCHFELAPVFEVVGDTGSAESMVSDQRLYACGFRPAPDYPVGVLLVQRLV